MLFETHLPGSGLSWGLVAVFTILNLIFFLVVITLVVKAHRKPVVSGQEELVGSIGIALEAFAKEGSIRIHSETWQARCSEPLKKGDEVRVKRVEGLTLVVEPKKTEAKKPG